MQAALAGLRVSNLAPSWQPLTNPDDCVDAFHTITKLCSSWLASTTTRRIAVDISTGKRSMVATVGNAGFSSGADVLHFPCYFQTPDSLSKIINVPKEDATITRAFEALADETIVPGFFGDIEVDRNIEAEREQRVGSFSPAEAESTASDIATMHIQLKNGVRLFQGGHWNSCASCFVSAEKKEAKDDHAISVFVYIRVASIYKHWNNLAFIHALSFLDDMMAFDELEELQARSHPAAAYLKSKLEGVHST